MPVSVSSSGFLKFLTTGTFAICLLLFLDFIPLGIPGEWTWSRIPLMESHFNSLLFTSLVAGIIFIFIWHGSKRISCCKSAETLLWLLSLTLISSLAPLLLCQSAPETFGIQRDL